MENTDEEVNKRHTGSGKNVEKEKKKEKRGLEKC